MEALQKQLFCGAIQFNWCHWHSTAHRNISKKFVMLWAWKWSKTQIIWEARKLIRDGIHRLPVSWQTQCHGALGRTVHACKCGPCKATAGFPPTGGCCYSRGPTNETRIASTTVERRTGTGDSCAGDRFTSRSYQSEGVKGPNPGKPGSHPLDTNPNRVPVTDANMWPKSMMIAPAFPVEWSRPRLDLSSFRDNATLQLRVFLYARDCSCPSLELFRPFWNLSSGPGVLMALAVSHQPLSSGYPQGRGQTAETQQLVSKGMWHTG